LFRGIGIADQCVAGGDTAGLADADAQAKQEHLGEILRDAAQGGERTPHAERDRDHPAPAGLVGQQGERDRQRRIERGEGEAAEHAELGIGEMQACLHRLGEDAEDLPVEEIERVDQKQHREDEAAGGGGGWRHVASLDIDPASSKPSVIPAQAGIQRHEGHRPPTLDPGLRGDDDSLCRNQNFTLNEPKTWRGLP
jgi:hypothetical protein